MNDTDGEAVEALISVNNGKTPTEVIEIIIYTICLCVGGPLNIISFYKLLRNIRKSGSNGTYAARSSAQITLLRLHLNIADLLTMFVYTASQIIWMLTVQWYGGDLLCRICKFFHTFSFYLNSFVIACIAIDRVFGTYNLSTLKASQRSYMRCRKMLTVAWILAFCFSLPQAFIFRVFEIPGENFKQCIPVWTEMLHELRVKFQISAERHNISIYALEKMLVDSLEKTPADARLLNYQANKLQLYEGIYNVAHLLLVFWTPALIIVASYITVMCLLNSFAPTKKDPRWKRSIIQWLFGDWSIRKNSPANSSIHAPSMSPRPSIPADISTQQPLLVSTRPDHSPMLVTMKQKSRGMSYGNFKDPLYVESNGRLMSTTSLKIDFTPRRTSAAQRNVGPIAMQTINRARQVAKRQAAFIIIAYLAFWTPYNLLAAMLTLSSDIGPVKEMAHGTLPFLNAFIVVNPLVNPLIYGLFDKS